MAEDGIANCYPFLPYAHLGSLEKMSGKGEVSLLCWTGRDQTIERRDNFWYNHYGFGTGDVRWIESHIGAKVDQRLMERVFIPLLSREQW
ncbi:MAG: hypothetical protein BBJ60_01385 [Desulfobacterales bacterium S7086C20]|nr:MAG: hypothetical protein BBJ60_01385 [Desulfobacterales bacterium S7086C20]